MDHAHGHAPQQHDSSPHPGSWADARRATLHCLTGCAIGEVLGMVIGTSAGFSDAATVALAIALAFFGYALTVRVVRRAGSLAVAFVATAPVNRVLMGRGRGHAVVHALH